MQAMSDELKLLRERIRSLDDQLLALVKERLEVARAIGAVKVAAGLPIKDYKVEKDVLARATQKARELGLYEELATDLSKLLIRYAVNAQDEFKQRQTVGRATQPSRILIAGGLGRMGRWLADFFDSFGHQISLYEPRNHTLPASSSHEVHTDLEAAAHACDVIVLSTPISETPALIDRLTKARIRGLVFDICSLKSPLLAAIGRARRAGQQIASVHPMFGPQVEVLADRNIVICDCGDAASTAAAQRLFENTSAKLVHMQVDEHDRMMSCVLGLSHLSNLVFGEAIATSGIGFEALRAVASTTFSAQLGVTTPVVNENPDLYYEIQVANTHTTAMIATFEQAFKAYRQAIEDEDREAFGHLMLASRQYLGDARND